MCSFLKTVQSITGHHNYQRGDRLQKKETVYTLHFTIVKIMNIIVIGSGFGGLSAAIRLQAQGHNVTIIEKRDKTGGRAYVYEQEGFIFDGGPTIITAPWLIDELFALAEKKPLIMFLSYPSTLFTMYVLRTVRFFVIMVITTK